MGPPCRFKIINVLRSIQLRTNCGKVKMKKEIHATYTLSYFLSTSLSLCLRALTLPVHSASPVKWLLAGCVAADSKTAVVAPQGSYVLKNHMGLYCVQLYRHFQSITHEEKGVRLDSQALTKFEQENHYYTISRQTQSQHFVLLGCCK